MAKKENIIVICAHSDDQVFGVGGTLAKYAEEGKNVYVIVFSFGWKANIWLRKEVASEIRVKESQEAGRILGVKQTIFLGIEEGRFKEQFEEKRICDRLETIFRRYRPAKIFTHSIDDPHPDHKELAKFVMDFCEIINFKGDIFAFDVWNPLPIQTRELPKIVVDISKTFKKKLKALRCFKSQWSSRVSLTWKVYWNAYLYGRQHKCRYAEIFYKMR